MKTSFDPPFWLKHRHIQTIFPSLFRKPIFLPLEEQIVTMPDGELIDCRVRYVENPKGQVIVLHGMGGSIDSHYAKPLMKQLNEQGFTTIFMHLRGASGLHRTPTTYHAANTEDLAEIIRHYHRPPLPLYLIGFSLGASILIKYLGEHPNSSRVTKAFAISPPFELEYTADYINHGIRKLYQRYLLRHVHKQLLNNPFLPLSHKRLKKLDSFWEFDEAITAQLHGFQDARDYYKKAACKPYLATITTPLHIIHAKDDPIVPEHVIPTNHDLSPTCHLHIFNNGGHVGFIAGNNPFKPKYFLEEFILSLLKN